MSAWISIGVLLLAASSCTSRSPERTAPRASEAIAEAIDGPPDAPVVVAASAGRCGDGPAPSLGEGEGVRTAIVLIDGRLLVSGKQGDGPVWTAVIDLRTGARMAADIPGEVSVDQFLSRGDGSVLALGHVPPLFKRQFTAAARFDPADDKWDVLPPPPKCLTDDTARLREEHRVTVELAELPGNVVLAVGHRCAAYLVSSKWVTAPAPPTQRRAFSLTTLSNGDLLRIGGLETKPGDTGLQRTSGVERFDVKRRRWQPVASMWYTRHAHTSTLRPDGSVVVIGGCEGSGPVCNGEGPSPPVEIYEPATDRWNVVGTAPITDRWAHTATAVGDRIVLLGGAANPEYSPRPTGILDGDRWLEAPAPAWRSHHTAVVVGDRVLLAGPLNHEFSPPLAWYGVAADCPTTEVRLGPAPPPLDPRYD